MENKIRNRNNRTDVDVQNTVRSGMFRLENAVSDSMTKFRLLPSRAKLLVALSAVLSLVFYIYLARWLWSGDKESQLELLIKTDYCPACYGHSACGLFYGYQFTFSGMSKFRSLDIINQKNVHFAYTNYDNKPIVIKRLGKDSEIKELDERICSDAYRPLDCDIARVVTISNMVIPLRKAALTPEKLRTTGSFMFFCPSYRLLDRVWTYFKEYKKKDEVFLSDKVQLLYMNLLNPEPLILQTFPKSEGWPFPEYIGSCGRLVVEEHSGRPLTDFFHESFQKRADLAYQLMVIADTLTTKSDFALYLTDVSFENFAVDESGKVAVIDLEHVIVVDKVAIEAHKAPGWDELHEGIFNGCNGENCLLFNTEKLCSRVNSDHNYNAICRNLLSTYANENGLTGGLLHDMPVKARDYWQLDYLLNECTRPSQKGGRLKVKDKLIRALSALRDGSEDHLMSIRDSKKRLESKTKLGHDNDQI